jgi:predicted glycosyltransferase
MSRNKRILFYSHDTFGLGHIRRTLKIANRLAESETSILIACSSPKARSFVSQPGIDYLNLPGFAKQVTGEYAPQSLNIPMEDFVELRSSLLLSAVKSFKPNIVIIDKEPIGVKKELLPSLEYLKENHPSTKIICGFRDILDEPVAVGNEFARKGTFQHLRDYFDHIFIYGEKPIFDFCQNYAFPEDLEKKIFYTGYIPPDLNNQSDATLLRFDEERPLVTLTLGGGGDGWPFLEVFLDILEQKNVPLPFNSVVLTGPFAPPELIQKARALSSRRGDIICHSFISNTLDLFQRSHLVISMGGYNTMTELAALQKYPLIIPRVVPRLEQLIRAMMFHDKDLADYIHPEDFSRGLLEKKIEGRLRITALEPPPLSTPGLENIRKFVERDL